MNEIIFQTLTSTATGVGASSGKQTEVAFNANFELVKTYLDALLSIASITVTSEQITQIKVDTSTTPYSLFYTMDPVDTDPADVTWYDMDNVSFADILGSPMDNIALATAFNSKANASDVSTLGNTVSALSTTVQGHTTSIANNTHDISTNTHSIATIQGDMVHLVHSPISDGTLYLRYNTTHTRVEYSLDNSQWFNIASGAVSFGDIAGSPTANVNLVSYVTSAINQALLGLSSVYASVTDFNNHVNNTNNPHQVTKAQLGLGNVDNTSDADKPIPAAMQDEINELWLRYPKSAIVGNENYFDLFYGEVVDGAFGNVQISTLVIDVTSGGLFNLGEPNIVPGSITIDDGGVTYVDTQIDAANGNIVDTLDNIVATIRYDTGVITSTTLDVREASLDYSYIDTYVSQGSIISLQHINLLAGSVSLSDDTNTYTDNGSGHLLDTSQQVVASVDYQQGEISMDISISGGTISYKYKDPSAPEDALYYTSSIFNN